MSERSGRSSPAIYQVEILPAAQKELAALSNLFRDRIIEKIHGLALNPRTSGCVALQAPWKGLHRIRSGNYWIVYLIQDARLIVTVIKIGDRRQIYKNED